MGILLAHARFPVEGLIVMFIAVLIIRLGIMNIWTPMLILLDANLDPRLQEAIEDRISRIDGIKRVHDVKIRQSGPFRMVECNIATKASASVFKAHELANMVEKIVEDEFKGNRVRVCSRRTCTTTYTISHCAGQRNEWDGFEGSWPFWTSALFYDLEAGRCGNSRDRRLLLQ